MSCYAAGLNVEQRTGRTRFVATGAVVALLATSLRAPPARAQSLEHEPRIEIMVRGTPPSERERARAFAAPEGVNITDAEQMKARAPQSLADAVRESPGVTVQQTTPGQGTIYVRGLSGRAVTYAVDGVRLNTAFFRAGNNDYLGLVDPYALEAMTVVPGATSVEYGSDGLGGAVLMTTRVPHYRLGRPAMQYQVFQSVSSNPVATASRIAVGYEASESGAHAGFTYFRAGPIRPGEGTSSPDPSAYAGLEREPDASYVPVTERAQLGTEFEFYAADVSVRRRLGHLNAVVRGQLSVRPDLVRYDQITPRFKRDVPQRAEQGLRPMGRYMVSLDLSGRRTGPFERTALLLAWQRIFEHRYQRNWDEICVDDAASSPEDCAGRLRLQAAANRAFEDNRSDAFTLRAEGRAASRDVPLSVIVGVEGHHDIVSSSAERLNLQSGERTAGDSRYPDGSSLSELGLFGHGRWAPAESFHLFAGARAGVFLLDAKERGGDAPAPALRDTLLDFAASFGARWELVPGVAWALNAARGVRSPNLEDIAGIGSRAGGRFQIANPDLGPEHSFTADTGIKLRTSAQRLQTFLFFTRYYDAIILAPTSLDGETMNADGELYYRSANAASVDLYGIEANGELALGKRVSAFARALVMLGTQHNPAGSDFPSETPADRVPPAQGELGARWRVTDDVELEGRAVGRARQDRLNDPVNLDDNRIPVGGTPGYVTYHASVAYQASPELAARLAFDNITDELVLEHGSGFYRPGFSVTGSLELSLERAAGGR